MNRALAQKLERQALDEIAKHRKFLDANEGRTLFSSELVRGQLECRIQELEAFIEELSA